MSKRLAIPLALAGLACIVWWLIPQNNPSTAHLTGTTYVGKAKCLSCHQEQAHHWTGSDHDRAMDLATSESVLGNFNNQNFTHQGITHHFFKKDDAFYMRTTNAQGSLEDFKIAYTFGVRPLQQYMVRFDDGSVQVLPLAWDTTKNKWFHIYGEEAISHHDVLHWTKPAQRWNHMCADCHSTHVQKNFDAQSKTYNTTFSDIDVSCEACHGPGDQHLKWATSNRQSPHRGLIDLGQDATTEIETCARCHANRAQLKEGFKPGDRLLDFYSPTLLDGAAYHVDGQVLEEDFVYGSFVQSKMHHAGVRCTSCHDPHSTRLKMEGNQLCLQCHVSETYDSPSHHHHPPNTSGSQCINCHMPEHTFMQIDKRRDHRFGVPRPDLSESLGVPNACNSCHADTTPAWAMAQLKKWQQPHPPTHFAEAIQAGRQGQPRAHDLLLDLLHDNTRPAFLRASALTLLSSFPSQQSLSVWKQNLSDSHALVRARALRNFGQLPAEEHLDTLLPLLNDPVLLVRHEAVLVLSAAEAFIPDSHKKAFNTALKEYIESQLLHADTHIGWFNLGSLQANLKQYDKALNSFARSLEIMPLFAEAHLRRATVFYLTKQNDKAEAALKYFLSLENQGRQAFGDDTSLALFERSLAEGAFTLGLMTAENTQRLPESLEALNQAVRLDPSQPLYHYNQGAILMHLGKNQDAEAAFTRAIELDPGNKRYRVALSQATGRR